MEPLKISVPQPCPENWDAMSPDNNGRFCDRCAKTVVDFTPMLPEEVQHYFVQHAGQKICGRFTSAQLNRLDINIPEKVLYRKRSFRKAFLLALFVVMGSSLFSCGDRRELGEVGIVKDTVKAEEQRTLGMPIYNGTSNADTDSASDKPKKKTPVKHPTKKATLTKAAAAVEPIREEAQEVITGKAIIGDTIIKK